ncbi:MAG: ABC transporter ATP-binding protein [Candidatus Methylomirabilota bacterium]
MTPPSTPDRAALRLALRGITKIYPSVVANDRVDLDVAPGQIHAVLGENGAGKSTLMKIIYGVVRADAGEIRWDGRPVGIGSPTEARRLGIGMVFQHFSLFETLSVAENISLAVPGSLKELSGRIAEVSERYGLPVDPRKPVHTLSVGERQRVEIVRCLLQAPRLLILDEPTSVLPPQAVERLFETLRKLAAEGVSILYISHKLEEIQSLCHAATILRAGRVVGVVDPRRESAVGLARLMIGRDLPPAIHPEPCAAREERLAVAGLTLPADEPFGTALREITLRVSSGEIVGIAGVSGNGQRELMTALSGERLVEPPDAIRLCGAPAGRLGPQARRLRGLAFVPEERLGRGAVPPVTLAENALLTAAHLDMVRSGFVRTDRMRTFAERCIREFDVKAGGPDAAAQSLSGGNLQKYLVGRELLQHPRLLLVSQPTWGLDVGAAAFIRQRLVALRNAGTAILVVSEELEELFEISDRIAVMCAGRLTPAVPVRETSVAEIGAWMTGLFPAAHSGGGPCA